MRTMVLSTHQIGRLRHHINPRRKQKYLESSRVLRNSLFLSRSDQHTLRITSASIENPQLNAEQVPGVTSARGRFIREKYFPEKVPLPPPTCILPNIRLDYMTWLLYVKLLHGPAVFRIIPPRQEQEVPG